MRLTKASAYGVQATIHIFKSGQEGPVQGRVIAEAHSIPVEYLLKILQSLVRAQILQSETGRRGGFTLRRPGSEISLLDIVEAIDGPVAGDVGPGRQMASSELLRQRLNTVFGEVATNIRSVLAQQTIDRLASS